MASEADEESLDLFQEPADFYEPEKQATFAPHQLLSGKELTVRLVGHNPLWVRHYYHVSGVEHRPFIVIVDTCCQISSRLPEGFSKLCDSVPFALDGPALFRHVH
jgi:hypothetical protein